MPKAATDPGDCLVARQKEFESPTFRLGGGCSIQLSYWRIYWDIVSEKFVNVNWEGKFMFQYNIQHNSADSESERVYTVPPKQKDLLTKVNR